MMKKIFSISICTVVSLFFVGCVSKPSLGLNEDASVQVTDELPENPLLLHAITSSIRPKDSTMSTLYGNDAAFVYAGSHIDSHYTEGSVLYEVTWRQQPDEQWTGGNIPERILCITRIEIVANGRPIYAIYKGTPLKKMNGLPEEGDKIMDIIRQRMAIAP